MSTALHWATLAAYFLGSLVFLAFVVRQKRPMATVGNWLLWAGFGLHTAGLATAWAVGGLFPAVGLRASLDVFSWALMGAYLFTNLRLNVLILGAAAGPASLLLLVSAAVLPPVAVAPTPVLKSLWLAVHVLSVLAGYGLLALTFVGSLFYLVQEKAIRDKNLGRVFKRLPSLHRADELIHMSLMAGFLLMSIGLILGGVYAQVALGSFFRADPKEVWSLITWLLYAALIHSRLMAGWRGRRGAWFSVIAFGALLFGYLGAGLLFSGYHAFTTVPTLTGVAR